MNSGLQLQDIRWERICLRLVPAFKEAGMETGRQKGALAFFLVNKATGTCVGKLLSDDKDGGSNAFLWNVTNRGDNRCLATGEYLIAASRGGEFLGYVRAGQLSKETLTDLDRVFTYQKTKTYSVSFDTLQDGELVIRILQKEGKTSVKSVAAKSKRRLMIAYYKLWKTRFKSRQSDEERKKTVLFLTEQSESLPDNLKAVYESMKARQSEEGWKLLVSTRSVRTRQYDKASTLGLLRLMARSGVIVIDDHVPILDWLMLSGDTRLIQLWHAGVGFKATGYSRWGHKGAVGPMSSHRQITLATVSSLGIRNIFSELWGIDESQVIPCGIPRMDAFLNPEISKKVKERLLEQYPICRNKKVILLAPTYRGRGKRDAHYPLEKIDFPALKKTAQACGYVVLVKMHPWITQTGFVPKECRDVILECDPAASINDLFLITDLLITDYSSNLFEFSLLQRPMLFYAFDEQEYATDRGFHRPYRENAPGKVVAEFDALLRAIETEDFEAEKLPAYVARHFDHPDDRACERVIDWLIKEELPGEFQQEIAKKKEEIRQWKAMRFPVM